MKKNGNAFFLLAATMYCPVMSIQWPSFNSFVTSSKEYVQSWWTHTSNDKLIQQEIPFNAQESICIENHIGSINIKSEWAQPKISLTAYKKSVKTIDDQECPVLIDVSQPNSIHIKAAQSEKKDHEHIDFELIVPQGVPLHVITHKGVISAHKLSGSIAATADMGNIDLQDIKGTAKATITTQGYISIKNVYDAVNATTKSGTINLLGSHAHVTATTYNGKITLSTASIPAAATIRLSASNGINLSLPPDISAHIQAHNEHGNITSDLIVHLENVSMPLNNATWNNLKRTINGTIGNKTNASARIVLHANNGTIKLQSLPKKS